MSESSKPSRTRAQQRLDTQQRILAAARHAFAELGYEHTTIRAVAAAAGVNAGLVMHYFGSKEQLFTQAVQVETHELPPGEPAEALLSMLRRRLDDEPAASLALLRSVLTHAGASDDFRDSGRAWLSQVGEAIPHRNADLRAALITAIITGVVIDRHLLKLSALADASADDIIELLRPCFESLAGEHTNP
ncbi:TetR family transcriptional regulator [Nonomuraea sp. NPDC005692]|uniref:TetR family transcriptional regulator n=1 Tax=Nonomuraea sp. NPDC005692 TaxID=3157168 RepID=UPI0033E9A57B